VLETPLAVRETPLALSEQPDEAYRSKRTKRESNLWIWTGTAFAVSLGLAVSVLALRGINTKSLDLALQLTARWTFLLFWPAYAGGAMAELCGPIFEPLARRGRAFGLAFAAALTVHLGVVAGLFLFTLRPPLTGWLLAFFLTGAFWAYLLTVFSFGGLARKLGPRAWRVLRVIGLNYILCTFAFDFLRVAIHRPADYELWRLVQYAPFAAMCIAAPLLVLAAAFRTRVCLSRNGQS
jgi:hypothetical protein